jgi:hypothetical protein
MKARFGCANDGASHERAAEAALIDRRANGGPSPDFGSGGASKSAGLKAIIR